MSQTVSGLTEAIRNLDLLPVAAREMPLIPNTLYIASSQGENRGTHLQRKYRRCQTMIWV
jgi:hypothetical protein